MMSDHQIVALLHGVPYLHDLSAEIVRALADIAVPICYSAGTLIFVEGEPCAGLYLIEDGIVKISRFSKDGREFILHLSHPGDIRERDVHQGLDGIAGSGFNRGEGK